MCTGTSCNAAGLVADRLACCSPPASCGDKDGDGPTSDAVSDEDCAALGGQNSVRNSSAAASLCAGSVCDISEAAVDRATCCMLSLPLTDFTTLVRCRQTPGDCAISCD
eukprot:COSAG04_NODE_43_length_31842_cov_15.704848_20_plen_109_part_00